MTQIVTLSQTEQINADSILTVLAGRIGTYTYNGGFVEDAFKVEQNTEKSVERPKVSGLEVVLEPNVDVKRTDLNTSVMERQYSRVTLKQWDLGLRALEDAQYLYDRLDNVECSSIEILPRNEQIDNLDQVSFLLFDLVDKFKCHVP